MTPLEIVAVVVSFTGIWLTATRRMLCWPVNLIACALYFKLFLDVRLYADMMLQAVFAGALPWIDATLSSFSLVAQYWTARRHSASWLLWIAVDIVYVGMFVVKGLMLTAGLYAAMILLALLGYRQWQAARQNQARTPSASETPPVLSPSLRA